ncbi:ECF transporter S component [Vagococcus lutrae]|uniref:ECF transporter S component n=1 Tax=Vagococcus lutrae TaxID=81947 RepID=UPI00200EA946|nr:ECF transporter S component [Vagococcus lutrae]MCO7151568.1 ECF transporter S component [Vagococcus lutrae]MDT2812906.1 ECF transporter S component [Vagococcus lutrae]MDT2819602.1 ECF transporter S component [Vagococcus lutrae]MDT2824309.1 ECF transporter S component [Vagococcus lutrae]MDT2844414.1 ECF transporter S component [Vagococcus lutrae]
MKTRDLTLTAIFLAIIFLFAFTPLGFINLGVIKATLIHVPVIIGSIVLGPRIGALLGLAFGGTSLLINTLTPSLLSFAFSPFIPVIGTQHGSLWALVIVFIPRILVGIVPYYVFKGLEPIVNKKSHRPLAFITAGIAASMTNTLLVMNLIYLLFQDAYAMVKDMPIGPSLYKAVLTVIFVNGVPEAIVAGIATAVVTPLLLQFKNKRR